MAKDNLIVDYITARHIATRHELDSIIGSASSPQDAVKRYLAAVVEEISRPGFRGCAFINAAAEFPESTHPVRQIVTAHRELVHRRAFRPHALPRARDPG